MKRSAAILCAALMLTGLCACKKADKAADSKITTTAPTTTTTTIPEEPIKAALNLTYASAFSEGVAFVRYLDADGAELTAAINTAGDVLFSVPADVSIDGAGYKHGIRVVGDVIYDKTGAVIASPEVSGYDRLMTGNCGGYVLAKKLMAPADATAPEEPEVTGDPTEATSTTTTTTSATEETTTTTRPVDTEPVEMVLAVGVLNNKGEWVQPLSPDHPIAVAITNAVVPTERLTYLESAGVLQVYVDLTGSSQYYHFDDNTLTPNYVHYESINYQDEDTGIYQVAADGSKKMIIKDVVSEYSFKDVFIGRTTVENEEGEITTTLKLYDYSGKALADLTDYPTKEKYYFVDDRLLITVDDGSGSRYMAMLGKDGKALIDPVQLNLRDAVYAPDTAGFVVCSLTAEGAASYRHYDYAGQVTEYADVTAFTTFSEGLAAVTLTDGTLCYINYKGEIVIR